MSEPTVDAKREIVERKLSLYRNTIYDQEIELRVMDRVKDLEGAKRVKESLVKLEMVVDELEKILKEVGD